MDWENGHAKICNKGAFDQLADGNILEVVTYLFDTRYLKDSIRQILRQRRLSQDFERLLRRLPRKFGNQLLFYNYAGELAGPTIEQVKLLRKFFRTLDLDKLTELYFGVLLQTISIVDLSNDYPEFAQQVIDELIELRPKIFFNQHRQFDEVWEAVAIGHERLLLACIDEGLDLNNIDDDMGFEETALKAAANYAPLNMMKILLDHGADPNVDTETGRLIDTIFDNNMAAMDRGMVPQIVELLLQYKVKIDTRSDQSLLWRAVTARMPASFIRFLLNKVAFHPRAVRFAKNASQDAETLAVFNEWERRFDRKNDEEEPPLKRSQYKLAN